MKLGRADLVRHLLILNIEEGMKRVTGYPRVTKRYVSLDIYIHNKNEQLSNEHALRRNTRGALNRRTHGGPPKHLPCT